MVNEEMPRRSQPDGAALVVRSQIGPWSCECRPHHLLSGAESSMHILARKTRPFFLQAHRR